MSTEGFCAVCSAWFRDLQMNSGALGGFRDSVSSMFVLLMFEFCFFKRRQTFPFLCSLVRLLMIALCDLRPRITHQLLVGPEFELMILKTLN